MLDSPTLKINEAKRYTGLDGRAWEEFVKRTGLTKIPYSDRYNKCAIDFAMKLDGHAQIIEANSGNLSEERQACLRLLLHQQGGRGPEGQIEVGTKVRLPLAAVEPEPRGRNRA